MEYNKCSYENYIGILNTENGNVIIDNIFYVNIIEFINNVKQKKDYNYLVYCDCLII